MTRATWLLASALVLGGGLAACDGGTPTDTDTPDAPTGPDMVWTDQPTDVLVEGTALPLTVTATDDDGVDRVIGYYRTIGARTWIPVTMMPDGDTWIAEVPGEDVVAPGIEVYFKGEDAFGQASFLPTAGLREPFVSDVRRVGVTLPYEQDFEDVPNDMLREIAWDEYTQEFGGYEWVITNGRGNSGSKSVFHRRTPSTVEQDIEDWLVSPPLDLTSMSAIQVSWMEFGDDPGLSTHELWISTGSPDPAQGDYELVTALGAPLDGAWGRSDTVDLSAYSGAPAAYLAWVYTGRQADIWWIDDVSVRALAADLRVTDLSWTPDPLSPGDSGTLSLTVENRTNVAAADVEVLVSADRDFTFDAIAPVASIPGNDSVVIDVPLTVAGDALDNSWVDLDVTMTTATDTYDYADRILIGEPSLLSFSYRLDPLDEVDTAQLVRLTLGAGSVEDPALEVPLFADVQTSGDYTVELDITEHAGLLPPAPGGNRWWVRVENGPVGEVTDFTISAGGEAFVSTDLGAFFGFAPEVYFLPRPPDPTLSRQTSTPSPIGPGDSVSWVLDLVNRGESTSGVTTVTLSTADPLVTLTDAGPKTLSGSEGWRGGSLISSTFAFDVAAERKSSLPIRMIATVEDDYETFEVPVDVQVPYPLISVTGVLIDDSAEGDGDGLIDPSETATLEVALTNVGGLNTFGATTCTMVQTGGTASATVDTSSVFAGIVSAGSTTNEDFDVTVTSGAIGDTLDFEVRCTDREETYVSPLKLVLGERPWIRITPLDDKAGDERDGYRFDFQNGRYRSDGETLQIQLTSYEDFGGMSGLFIEAWSTSPSADYVYYNLVAAGTSGTMRGYRGGFTPLGSFTVTQIDARTVQFDVPLEDFGLVERTLTIGFAAGFCGGTTQFCDHYPDGWGAPYTGLSTSRWVNLRW